MKLSEINFSNMRLAFQKGAGKKLNVLVGIIGKGLINRVSGNVQARQTADGWTLFFPPSSRQPTVAGVGSGVTRTDVSGGAVLPVDAVAFNFDTTDSAGSVFLTIDGGSLVFSKPGTYLVSYASSIEVQVKQAIDIKPVTTEGEIFLRAGEQQMPGTSGFCSATEIPNLTGFLKLDEGETELILDTDLTSAHVTSEALTALVVFKDPESAPVVAAVTDVQYTSLGGFGVCGEYLVSEGTPQTVLIDCQDGVDPDTPPTLTTVDVMDSDLPPENIGNAIDYDATETEGVIESFITQDSTDITTANATPLTEDDTDPGGGVAVKGSAAGSCIVTVVREETTMDMKIDIGGTLYAPKVDVYGQRNAGRGDVFGLNLTISVLKL